MRIIKNITKNISHYGDILAIPFFALLALYFYNIENKTIFEYVLFLFSIAGFILDIFYTYIFLSIKKSSIK
jgi:hypothetical protein